MEAGVLAAPSALTSAEPTRWLRSSLADALVGTLLVDVNPTLAQDYQAQLSTTLSTLKIEPMRPVTEEGKKKLLGSLEDFGVSTFDHPLRLAIVPDEWRKNGEPTQTEDLEFFAAKGKDEHLSYEDIARRRVVTLDGRHRLAAFGLAVDSNERPLSAYVELYGTGVFLEKALLEELVFGENRRHGFARIAESPSLASRVDSIHRARLGENVGRHVTFSEQGDLRRSFFAYASSRARLEGFLRALKFPIAARVIEGLKATPQAVLLSRFGSATPLLFVALESTGRFYNFFDPGGSIVTPEALGFISHMMETLSVTNPLFLSEDELNADEGTNLKLRVDRCAQLAQRMKDHLKEQLKQSDRGAYTVGNFKSAFHGVGGAKNATASSAKSIVDGLNAFFERLEDQERCTECLEGMNELDVQETLFLTRDLAAVTGVRPTPLVKSIQLVKTEILEPFAKVMGAFFQLARPNLHLEHSPHDFDDPEPYLHLLFEPEATDYVTKMRPRSQVLERWPTSREFSAAYQLMLLHVCTSRATLLIDCLSTKMRWQFASTEEKARVLNLVVPARFQSTDQGKVIAENLHLALFALSPAGVLTPFLHSDPETQALLGSFNVFVLDSFTSSFLDPLEHLAEKQGLEEGSLVPSICARFSAIAEVEPTPSGLDEIVHEAIAGTGNFEETKIGDLASEIEIKLKGLASVNPALRDPPPPEPSAPAAAVVAAAAAALAAAAGPVGGPQPPIAPAREQGGGDGNNNNNPSAGGDVSNAGGGGDGKKRKDREGSKGGGGARKQRKRSRDLEPTMLDDFAVSDDELESKPLLSLDQDEFAAKLGRFEGQMLGLKYLAFHRFRQSDCYEPFGTKIKVRKFNVTSCASRFNKWFDGLADFTPEFAEITLPSEDDPESDEFAAIANMVSSLVSLAIARLRLLGDAVPSYPFWLAAATFLDKSKS